MQQVKTSRYESLYKEADKFVIFNDDDPDLTPIALSLPSPPPIHMIDGYGLHPDEQMFKPLEVPQRLRELEKEAVDNLREINIKNAQTAVTRYKIIEEFWRLFDAEQDDLIREIEYLKHVHWYLRYGYWFSCDGKPTWISPWHFQYLNFWYMPETESGHPDYRDVDRRREIFEWYCFTTTETFKEVGSNGDAKKNWRGEYEMRDIGYRTCYGPVIAKRRRGGYTNQECSNNIWISSRFQNGHSDIVADSGQGAKDIWDQIFVPGWNELPIFLEPINDSTSSPSEIKLRPPRNVFKVKSLGSILGYTATAGERGNDKRKLYSVLSDEEGKTSARYANTRERWEINKLTLSQFDKIHGYSAHISSVEDMNEGGYIFEELNTQSKFYTRLPNGQTVSGLFRLFFHCWDGMDGYIGPFGESIIETPTERQIELAPEGNLYAKTGKGAKQAINDNLDFLLKRGTPSDIITYRERLRKNPRYYADCWIGITGDMGWDIVAIDRRMEELKRGNACRRVDLEWVNGVDFREGVYWIANDEGGKFIVSELFLNNDPHLPIYYGNQFYVDKNIEVPSYMPINPIGCAGADTFKWGNKTQAQLTEAKSYMSDGGGVGLWGYDPQIDGGKPNNDWQSSRIIWTYKNRVNQAEYFNDMAKAVVYFNMMLNVERNIIDLIKYFLEIGLYGYLLRNPKSNGMLDETPGYHLQDKSRLFSGIREYVHQTINREQHSELLQDMKDIKGPEQLFKFDRIAALGGAYMGIRSMGYLKPVEQMSGELDIDLSNSEFSQIVY